MGKELIEYLLDNNLDEFKKRFTKVLKQTPKFGAPGHIEFWIYFFLGSATTIQDQQLGSGSEIEGICFNVNKKTLKLAFKTQDDNVIIRYIEVVNSKNPSNKDKKDKIVEQEDLSLIKNTLEIKKDITTDDIKYITLNISAPDKRDRPNKAKTENVQVKDFKIETSTQPTQRQSGQPKKPTFQNINSGSESKKISSVLDLIVKEQAKEEDAEQVTKKVEKLVKEFFQKLADLYNANGLKLEDIYPKNQSVHNKSKESTYHGFVYGVLQLNYKNKYNIDVYVEYSSGRGYLDLYFLLRSNNNQKNNDQGQSAKLRNNQAIPIIVEFKSGDNALSLTDGMQQIQDMAYTDQLVARTEAKHAIDVSANFADRVEQILVKKHPLKSVEYDFIDTLISTHIKTELEQVKTELEQGIGNIFQAIRKEESLDLIILGELLSSKKVEDIDIYTFDITETKWSKGQEGEPYSQKSNCERVTVFVFTPKENNPVILSIIGIQEKNKYIRLDSSKARTRSSTQGKGETTVKDELNELISYIESKFKDTTTVGRVDIHIDPSADTFSSKGTNTKKTFLRHIESTTKEITAGADKKEIPAYVREIGLQQTIDISKLIRELQSLDTENVRSPQHDGSSSDSSPIMATGTDKTELDKLRDIFFTLDGLNLVKLEKDVKSIIHGLFLHKKLNSEIIKIIPELTAHRGRADLTLIWTNKGSNHDDVLVLELGMAKNRAIDEEKLSQVKGYIQDIKSITDIPAGKGVALIFNMKTADKSTVILASGITEKISHDTTDEFTADEKSPSKIISPAKNAPLAEISNTPTKNKERAQSGSSSVEKRRLSFGGAENPDGINAEIQPKSSSKKIKLDDCLPGTSRSKREVNSHCKISWEDVDKFNVEAQDKRDVEKIKIDSEKFVSYIKDINDREKGLQLSELGKDIIRRNADNIIGNDKYLMSKIIENNGYKNYVNNKLIQDIANNPNTEINTQLRSKLLNAAGKIQLANSVHGIISTCAVDNNTEWCLYGVAGFGYAFAAQPIENMLLKNTPRFITKISTISSRALPKLLGHNTKFSVQSIGNKIAKGTAGALGGAFDVTDIAISANNLVECNKREKTDDPCGNKEIRDSIASISFSGVSFVSGIALSGSTGPLIVVSLGILVIQKMYDGISNIIEYEKKYDTTHGENWSILWRTILFQDMAPDVKDLAARIETINKQIEFTNRSLGSLPDHIVAYAIGLGKNSIEAIMEEKCTTVCNPGVHMHTGCIIVPGVSYKRECSYVKTGSSIIVDDDYAFIDLSFPLQKILTRLSRVLPKPIKGAKFSCLPKVTNSEYEKEGTSNSLSSYPNVKYYCDNAVVIEHNAKMQNFSITDKSVLFDLRYVNSGKIVGSNTLNNIFQIYDGNPLTIVGGHSVKNYFVFHKDSYQGTALFGNNSINIIDISRSGLNNHEGRIFANTLTVIIYNKYVYKNFRLTSNEYASVKAIDQKYKANIQYIGVPKGRETIYCNYPLSYSKDKLGEPEYNRLHDIHVDTGGGTISGTDYIESCRIVTIRPYTLFVSTSCVSRIRDMHTSQHLSSYCLKLKLNPSTYYLTIKTDGYQSDKEAFISIDIHSIDKAYVTFFDIALLNDSKEVAYASANETLIMRFSLHHGGMLTVYMTPYIIEDDSPNFILTDKYGNNIIPILTDEVDDITYVKKFFIQARIEGYITSEALKIRYHNISSNNKGYEVFSDIRTRDGIYQLGSIGRDVMVMGNDTHYASGSEEADVYIWDDLLEKNKVIDNESNDKIIDTLLIPLNVEDIRINTYTESNHIFFYSEVSSSFLMVKDYLNSDKYQHLIVMDKNKKSYIPFNINSKFELVPFMYAGINIISSDVKRFIVKERKEDIKFYKENSDLILYSNNENNEVVLQDNKEINVKLLVKIQNFYGGNNDVKIFLYNNGSIDYNNLVGMPTDIPSNNLIQEHDVDFTTDVEIMFNHKIGDGIYLPALVAKQKLGIITIHKIAPKEIHAAQSHKDLILYYGNSRRVIHYVIVKDCFADATRYSPDILQFYSRDHEPIQVYVSNNSASDIDEKLDYASDIYIINEKLSNNSIGIKDIKCAYALYALTLLGGDRIYKILGFSSLKDMALFASECRFSTLQLLKLKQSHHASNTLAEYNDKLKYNVELQNYNRSYKLEQKEIISTYLKPDEIINKVEQFVNTNTSNSNSDSSTHMRQVRSTFDEIRDEKVDRDIGKYNILSNLDNVTEDSSAQVSSSASKPESWFTSAGQKVINCFKSVAAARQYFWGSSGDGLDLDKTINTSIDIQDQVLLNNSILITDSKASNTLAEYNDKLKYNVELQNYNRSYKLEQKEIISTYLKPDEIINKVEQFVNTNTSNSNSDSSTHMRQVRSTFDEIRDEKVDRDIGKYNILSNLDNVTEDSSAQVSSSASKPESWFTSAGQKVINCFKSVAAARQYFWGSSGDGLDLDKTINTSIDIQDQVLLNNSILITDSKASNTLAEYNDKLKYNVELQNYNRSYKLEQKEIISTYLKPDEIINKVEQFVNTNTSNSNSDSSTHMRQVRSTFDEIRDEKVDRDIGKYNILSNLDNVTEDSSAQVSSSASKPESWFTSAGQKVINCFKSVAAARQYFWGSSGDGLDLDKTINTSIDIQDQVLLNNSILITDSKASNTDTSAYFNTDDILYLGIAAVGLLTGKKNSTLNNSTYISPQNAVEIQREIIAQEVLPMLEQGNNEWGDDFQQYWDLLYNRQYWDLLYNRHIEDNEWGDDFQQYWDLLYNRHIEDIVIF